MEKVEFLADKCQVITEKYSDHSSQVVLTVGEYQVDRLKGLVTGDISNVALKVTIEPYNG
jgi:hypothetical protein